MCEACILAGGLSSRMGQDKAKLRLGGRTLLAHARAAARAAGFPVRVIRRDLVPNCGPLGGVYTALRTTRSEAVLFLSCDMPFVTSALLLRLRKQLIDGRKAVFLVQKRPGFPFVLRRTALREVELLLKEGRLSLAGLARRLRADRFRLRPEHSLEAFNANTPEEFVVARALWRSEISNLKSEI